MIRIQKKAGKPKEIDLEKRVMLLLFVRLIGFLFSSFSVKLNDHWDGSS
ncbi:hypothetical protein FHEFKHOI_00387 [Candidatus Methanoperedenaceae archaeon GB50]|nr:hypothetical protein FHEFKHOI_00387 [Candidatus Methanoperedenaceae archaeon GB50]CAD7779436.1 MAG: hypothetical protein KBONHNOK_01297 [Candidatus Methanoperedenaceae archaeon GB50]